MPLPFCAFSYDFILSILIPSLIIYYKATKTNDADQQKIVSAGNQLVGEATNLKRMSPGSFLTVSINAPKTVKGLKIENGNTLVVNSIFGDNVFYFPTDMRVKTSRGFTLRPGKNSIKINVQGNEICISDPNTKCDAVVCEDNDGDGVSTCDTPPDCNDDPEIGGAAMAPGLPTSRPSPDSWPG